MIHVQTTIAPDPRLSRASRAWPSATDLTFQASEVTELLDLAAGEGRLFPARPVMRR